MSSAWHGNLDYSFVTFKRGQQALEHHAYDLGMAKVRGDRAGEGRAYCNVGNAYQILGDFKRAIEYHAQGLGIAKELGDRAGEGRACCNLGNAYRSLGDFVKGIKYHTQHRSIAKELEDRDGEGRACCHLGNAYQDLGDFHKAIEYQTQVLSIAKELKDRAWEGGAYGNLGNAYQSLGDFKQAIEYHTQDLSIAKELRDKAGEERAYCNLGNACCSLGDVKQAIEYHKQHLRIAKELRDEAGKGLAYGNLGKSYRRLGDFKQAIEYHTKHLSIAKEQGDNDGKGRAYADLGNDYQSLGDFQQAKEYQTQSLSIAKSLGDRAGEGLVYGFFGNVYQCLGDFQEAIEYQTQCLSIAKELGDKNGEGTANGSLGNAYYSLGDYNQAIEYYAQHLNIAQELGNKAGEGCAYGNLGNAYRSLGDLKQAKECHQQSLSISKKLGDLVLEGQVNYFLGCEFEFSDALHEALDYYRASVKLFEDVRALLRYKDTWKISFRNTYRQAYTALWRALVRLENISEALCVAEEGRAQALTDSMKLQYRLALLVSGSLQPRLTISDILRVTSTQAVFVALESNKIHFWVLRKETNVQFRQKEVIDEDAATFLESLRKDVFNEYQISARVDCENRSLDGLNRRKLPPTREVEEKPSKTPHCENNSLRILHDCIIGPIADLLQGDELIIVPDGPLCLAPYAALIDEESRYLSESIRIRIVPSLTSLKLIADSAELYHRRSGALLVRDPCVEEITNKRGRPILLPLPYAGEEVKMIGKILDIPPLTGKEATKDEVLRQIGSVALIHIAAHGNMEAGEIALAPNPARKTKIPKERDYKLKIADVQAAKLRARLVVLSCCHSAQGTVTPEGVVGIARAFLGAGARSVLVALWAINDEATMEFMKSFYEHLSRGCSASVALNRAMKCLRESEKFGAVKFWAPFVLIGDDVTIEFGANQ